MAEQKGIRRQGRIFQRGGVWWIAHYRNATEIRESAETTDPVKAEQFLHERREASKTPTFVSPQAKKTPL